MDATNTLAAAGPDTARDSSWCALYRIAGVAALSVAVLTLIQIAVYVIWPPPSFDPTPAVVPQWFALLQRNTLLGLLELDLLMILDYVLMLLVYLALYVALRRANQSLMAVGSMIAFVAMAIYFVANPSLSMLALSEQHMLATTNVQRAAYVAAGQGLLAVFRGTPFIVHYVLMGIAGIVISWVMLQSGIFSRPTAYAGLLQGALMLVPSTAGFVGLVFAFGSLVPFVIWFVLVARRLFELAQEPAAALPEP